MNDTIGKRLELDINKAAYGISQIVDENMAGAGRMHAVESGMDIGSRTMIAFGGNGPLHATRVARRCGVKKIVIPVNPGVGSAVGFLDAPVSFEIIRSYYTLLNSIDIKSVNLLLQQMLKQAHEVVLLGAPDSSLASYCSAFMRYHGQGHEIEIPLNGEELKQKDLTDLLKKFETEYAFQYSRVVPNMEIEILNWAVKVTTLDKPPKPLINTDARQTVQATETRAIICDQTSEPVAAAVYYRQDLNTGDSFDGPALIVEPQTTTLVSSDYKAYIDTAMNIVMTKKEES